MQRGSSMGLIGWAGLAVVLFATIRPASAANGKDRALEYVPQALAEGRGADAGGLGLLLIVAAIILAIVIIGFVVRHHRSGRAG